MKTAIYIEDGTVQLVLTPEGDFEKNAMSQFLDKPLDAKLFAGSFYDCRGGWVRQIEYNPNSSMYGVISNNKDNSLILRVSETPPNPLPHFPDDAIGATPPPVNYEVGTE